MRGPVTVGIVSDGLSEAFCRERLIQPHISVVYGSDLRESRIIVKSRSRGNSVSPRMPGEYRLTRDGIRLRFNPAGPTIIETIREKSAGFWMRWLFHVALAREQAIRGLPTLHAAGLSTECGNVVVLGSSRSGKSTLCALALAQGARIVSDDLLLVDRNSRQEIEVVAMRDELHFRSPTDELLPAKLREQMQLAGSSTKRETHWVLQRKSQACFIDRGRVDAIWFTRIDRRRRNTVLTPVPVRLALARLISGSSPLFLSGRFPRERAASLPVLLDMAKTLPAFSLTLGRDLFQSPESLYARLMLTGLSMKPDSLDP